MGHDKIDWSIKDIVDIMRGRINNKFDFNFVVSGPTGMGKSTLIYKILSRFNGFKPKKHIVYSRREVIELIESQKKGFIFDDEAIRTGYNRNFFEEEQKRLIQIMSMYRDNFNIYASAIPHFYTLDKHFRSLIRMHLHVVKRGLAIIHVPNTNMLYSDDQWDVKKNQKIEDGWSNKRNKNRSFKSPHHKLSTFLGYVRFGDLPKKQRIIYEDIKTTKRKTIYDGEQDEFNPQKRFEDKVFEMVINRKITRDELQGACRIDGKKFSSVSVSLSRMLKDNGVKETLGQLLQQPSVPTPP